MQAKALTAYPINAFTGRELVRYEWRPVPAGCEAEAERLAAAGLVKLQWYVPVGFPDGVDLTGLFASGESPTIAADLDSLTIVQLKDLARERGVAGFSTMKKAELIIALRDD